MWPGPAFATILPPPMIRALCFLLLSAAALRAADPDEPPRDPAYQLVWADEFDGDGPVDESKWTIRIYQKKP